MGSLCEYLLALGNCRQVQNTRSVRFMISRTHLTMGPLAQMGSDFTLRTVLVLTLTACRTIKRLSGMHLADFVYA
eukprot:7833682-Pyramimonas_sp.AAC.1